MTTPLYKAQQRKILAAGSHLSRERARLTFEGYFPYLFVETLAEAKVALGPDIGLIMCSLDFGDHNGLFDLLRSAKANETTRQLPFLCLKANEDQLTPTILQSVEIATRAYGAEKLVMLYDWRMQYGLDGALEKLRALVRSYLD